MAIDISRGIRHARESIGVTQAQMAEILGVTKETISNYENNRTVPDIITLCKMSYVCELPIDYITEYEGLVVVREALDYILLNGFRALDRHDLIQKSKNVVSIDAGIKRSGFSEYKNSILKEFE